MKRALISAILTLGVGCGGEQQEEEVVELAPVGEPAAVASTTTTQVAVAAPAPMRGGTVLMAGPRPFEVVADREGTIDAYYLQAPPPAPQDARVTIRVPDAAGEVRPVLLTWDPAELRYSGRMREARPAPGQIELVFVLGGETLRASAATFVLVEPTVRVAARAVRTTIVQPARPEVTVVNQPTNPTVVVQPPSRPTVVIQPPARPTVVVQPPSRPTVVIQPPARPQVVVQPARPAVVVQPARPTVVVQAPRPPAVVVQPAQPARGGDRNRGHGNDPDGVDEDNPGRGRGRRGGN